MMRTVISALLVLFVTCPVTGQHKVMNNLVTELIHHKQRELAGKRTIEFTNPRHGWCYFSASGEATVRLEKGDGHILAAKANDVPAEAMRLLSKGRHTLRIEGQPLELIVRAIP